MRRDAIEMLKASLKCDAPGCDHVETVPEITADLIGKPCPKCGADLLTKEDHQRAVEMKAVMDMVNDLVGPLEIPDDQVGKGIAVSINPHGGKTTIVVNPGDA